jgi:WD40 repeat protein
MAVRVACSVILLAVVSAPALAAAAPTYDDDIKPLLREHCLGCHNVDEANSDLDLSTYAGVLKGGSSGPAVVAGRPATSSLYRAMAHLEGIAAMPPESSKLPDAAIDLVDRWIRGGLLESKGGKSLLKGVAAIDPAAVASLGNLPAIMPADLAIKQPTKTPHPPAPQAMATSPVAPLVAVSGQEQVLLLGPGEDESPLILLGCLPFPEGSLHALRFSRTGGLLVAGGGRGAHSGRAVVYDVATGERRAEVGDMVDVVLAADIDATQRYVAIGGPSKVVEVIELASGKPLHRIKKHTDWITALAFSPDGSMLASGDRAGGIHVWETEKGAIVFSLSEHKQRVTDLEWRTDGQAVASVSDDGNLILWNMKDGWPAANVAAHVGKTDSRYTRATGVLACEFRPDGGLVTIGRDGHLRTWSATGIKEKEVRIKGGLPIAAALLGTDSALVGTLTGDIENWVLAENPRLAGQISTSSE